MTKNVLFPPHFSGSAVRGRSLLRKSPRGTLSCVWIETGNARQPLACIWIDRDLRVARGAGTSESPVSEASDAPPLGKTLIVPSRRSLESRSACCA